MSDITLKKFAETLITFPITGAIEGIGNTLVIIEKLPQAALKAYAALIKTDAAGPVLKTTIGIILIPAAMLMPPMMLITGTGYGCYMGVKNVFKDGEESGMFKAINEALNDPRKHRGLTAFLLEMNFQQKIEAAIPKENRPYEIKVIEAIKGLAAGLGGCAIGLVAGVPIVMLRVLEATLHGWRKCLTILPDDPLLSTLGAILFPVGAALVAAFGPLAIGSVCFRKGAYDGYKSGFRTAAKNVFNVIREANKSAADTLKSFRTI
jgi:hypothetical protein